MKDIEVVVLGIVTGIITTVVIFLAKRTFFQIIVPWYLKLTYKGVDLAGNWSAKSGIHAFTLELKQYAHDIEGVLIISSEHKSKVKNSSHYIKGEVWEGYVSLKSNTVDKRQLSFGNLLLKVESGRLLKGIYTARRFQNNESTGIAPADVSFERDL